MRVGFRVLEGEHGTGLRDLGQARIACARVGAEERFDSAVELVAIRVVTEAGLTELRSRMPFANLEEFASNPIVQDFGNLLTVADMGRFIETKVEVTG